MPHLWGYYATDRNLLGVITDNPLRKRLVDRSILPPHILPSKLDRWFYYTKYVKRLMITGHHNTDAKLPTYLPEVLTLTGGQPLLPSLKALAVRGYWLEKPCASPILAALLSQAVQRLEIKFPGTQTVKN